MQVKTSTHPCGEGIQKIYKFGNGLTVSAIQTPYSYGGPDGKWEMAVMTSDGEWFTKQIFLDADDDVIGHLSKKQLNANVKEVFEYGSK